MSADAEPDNASCACACSDAVHCALFSLLERGDKISLPFTLTTQCECPCHEGCEFDEDGVPF